MNSSYGVRLIEHGCLCAVLFHKASYLSQKRIISFIDGFNLYHAIDDLNKDYLKWINLWALSSAFIQPTQEKLVNVYYFTAYATWLQDSFTRHQTYVKALSEYDVTTKRGHFKSKDVSCRKCGVKWKTREEKESDVNIAIYLLNEAHLDNYDKAFVISADSDLVPAIELVKKTFPKKEITVLTPPNRYQIAREIRSQVQTIKIKEKHLKNSLLPQKIIINGSDQTIIRPEKYNP